MRLRKLEVTRLIRVLDSFIADKIAAGEVIERPLSIVKELIENSVDAGATSIIVEIRNGGKTYIRVTDNGCGIPSDEVEIAFLRHATGKIATLEDLNSIHTLGFRGEALASISAISRISIVTRIADSAAGTRLTMHGGQKVGSDTVGCNIGTTMIVEDVFYNVPARRKFMGSDAREASAIIELVQKLAIFYADIRFMMINNGQTILSTEGDGDYRKAVMSIYPGHEFSRLIELDSPNVRGFISDPGTVKNNRKGQIFFVNGRIVDSKVIERGLVKGYGDRIFSGYPIAILFIDTPPQNIDVNIHPGKREIKFLYEDEIIDEISSAVAVTMVTRESIPVAEARPSNKQTGFIEEKAEGATEPKEKEKTEQVGIRDFLMSLDPKPKTEPIYNETVKTESPLEASKEITGKSGYLHEELVLEGYNLKPFDFEELQIVGYVFNSYIITQTRDSLYVLDQHAAHERIFYEQLVTRYNDGVKRSQQILTPILIETSQDIYNAERGWLDDLARMGYAIEDFGAGSFIIREIPEYMSLEEADRFAKTFIEGLEDVPSHNTTVMDKLIMRSCKSAIKANDKLSQREIEELINKLSRCRNPFSCPHGRPTFVKVTKYEIERAFKRK